MKLEGLILDKSDIIGEVKKRFGTEQTFTVGKVNLITTNPTQTITFHVSEELWSDGKGGGLSFLWWGSALHLILNLNNPSMATPKAATVKSRAFISSNCPQFLQ
ncbi:chemotaxis protein [Vibrio cholerae]|uniref:chemotaxis protein n=1 Tax=Vibrio cholerae TaxID=666 RepID=UPI00215595FB|nr:chemotaxis protein [Vibrio cholerae]